MIKKELEKLVQNALESLGVENPEVAIDYPLHSDFGDYSTNVALRYAKQLKKNPLELASDISAQIPKNKLISKVDVVKPGFINFYVGLEEILSNLNKQKEFVGEELKDKNVMIEYTDPNPFKEFHIGHLFSNTVGETLSRLIESQGAKVVRACYQGDVGMHVAKSIWGMQELMNQDNLTLDTLEQMELKDRINFIGKAYAYGATKYEEDEKAKQEITNLNKKIYEKDTSVLDFYTKGRLWSLEYFETIYKKLGTHFDRYYFESEVGEKGVNFVKENLDKGIFSESDGAVVFKGEDYGLHTRVFINSLGLPTYEAKDLGLAPTKYDDFKYDLSIIITGNEVNQYFKVVLKALELINPDLSKKTKHLSHGMVRLPEGKMSSRTGKVITGEWLINEATKRVTEIITNNNSLAHEKKESVSVIAEKVAIAAIKYALLKSSIGKDIEFNFDETVSFEGNSGPYLQYTYVRCQSILNKVNNDFKEFTKDLNRDLNIEETSLTRHLIKYNEVVNTAALNYSPNLLCNYLYELGQKFNLFYQKLPILKADDEDKNFRLTLTQAVGQTIKNGLYLLGIETVEKM